MKTIALQIDGDDFDRMTEDAYPWAGKEERWKVAEGRFLLEAPGGEMPSPEFKWVYFFPEWLPVVVCRAFIELEGYACQISSDQKTGKYCIHTDYKSPRVQKRLAEG